MTQADLTKELEYACEELADATAKRYAEHPPFSKTIDCQIAELRKDVAKHRVEELTFRLKLLKHLNLDEL